MSDNSNSLVNGKTMKKLIAQRSRIRKVSAAFTVSVVFEILFAHFPVCWSEMLDNTEIDL